MSLLKPYAKQKYFFVGDMLSHNPATSETKSKIDEILKTPDPKKSFPHNFITSETNGRKFGLVAPSNPKFPHNHVTSETGGIFCPVSSMGALRGWDI